MLMTAEDVVRTRLDAMYPKPVPYIGRPERNEDIPQSYRAMQRELCAARSEAARKRTEYLAQWEFERRRKAQIAASNPDVMVILAAVASAHNILLSVLLSKTRTFKVTRARHHAVWELKQRKPNMSSPKIATLLHRDHSTILSSLQAFEAHRQSYEDRVQAVARMLTVQEAA